MNALRTIAAVLLMASPTMAAKWPLYLVYNYDVNREVEIMWANYEWSADETSVDVSFHTLPSYQTPFSVWTMDPVDVSFTGTVNRISENVSEYSGFPDRIVVPLVVRRDGEIIFDEFASYIPSPGYDLGVHNLFYSDAGKRTYPFFYQPSHFANPNDFFSHGYFDVPSQSYAARFTDPTLDELCGVGVSPDILPGDFDNTRRVQFSDFVILANNFGNAGNWSAGDANCDGIVQFPDFVILANNFGRVYEASASVPEPSAGWWLASVLFLVRRRTVPTLPLRRL